MARAGGITNAVNVGIAVQADWENREFISNISLNVRRLFEFLVQFEATTKSKLATLNEKLDTLERRLELLEVQWAINTWFKVSVRAVCRTCRSGVPVAL
ncbi:Protein BRICK 1 [Quillaja saponaria]|uniref:Protein BRICK 1 n=1 Tax=Quillaja saponaria TaxID=32244 RepID=A0AAD7P683_QUISA|nr:Protein BRICK 1 [Quillaja saponaria]